MNLTRIYENIKKEYESKGIEIDEEKLRQLAWMKRDRMMFESNVAAAAAAAGAGAGAGGGGGRLVTVVPQVLEFNILTESGFPLINENDINLILE
jgi:hypothetical protein